MRNAQVNCSISKSPMFRPYGHSTLIAQGSLRRPLSSIVIVYISVNAFNSRRKHLRPTSAHRPVHIIQVQGGWQKPGNIVSYGCFSLRWYDYHVRIYCTSESDLAVAPNPIGPGLSQDKERLTSSTIRPIQVHYLTVIHWSFQCKTYFNWSGIL